jgi:hypothetical protein
MTQNLHQMTNHALKQYLSQHRNDEKAFRAALEVLITLQVSRLGYQDYLRPVSLVIS